MRILTLLLLLLVSCRANDDDVTPTAVDDDLAGPISRPSSGYGADGTHTVGKVSFNSPRYTGKQVDIFYPKDMSGPRPTIFYSHPYGGEESAYNIGLFNFIAKKDTPWSSHPTLLSAFLSMSDTAPCGRALQQR